MNPRLAGRVPAHLFALCTIAATPQIGAGCAAAGSGIDPGGQSMGAGGAASATGGAGSGGRGQAGGGGQATGSGGSSSGGAGGRGEAGGTAGATGIAGAGGNRGAAGAAGGVGGGGIRGTAGMGSAGGVGGAGSYAPCPARGTCAIMPLGDSITEGYRSSKGGGYRVQLFHDALQDGRSITFVGSAPTNGPATVDGVAFPPENEGHGGYRIAQISSLIVESMKTNKPNVILLMIGTNDVGTGTSPIGTSGAQGIANQLGDLIDEIGLQDPKVLLVVAQIVPHITDAVDANIQAYNALIPALVKARANAGRHVLLVDMHGAFLAHSNWKTTLLNQSDKQHPTDAGYVVMGDSWYPVIAPFLR